MAALRVLFVEDDDAYARLIAREVQRPDLRLERVATVKAARERLQQEAVDAVLLDLNLPETSGLATLEAMHAVATNTAIVVLTSTADEQMAVLAMQHGAQDYLLKHEVDGSTILRAVRHARERAAYQRALRHSEARFRALVEHGYDVITLLDAAGHVLFDSRSVLQVMGFAPEERHGRLMDQFLHPDDVATVREQFARCLAHPDEVVRAEYRFLHKDGSWRWGEAVGVNRLSDPAVQAIVVNHRDVTQRKLAELALGRSEEQLRQAQKLEAVGRLAGGIAHDFNNVLTAIFGYADLLLDQFTEGDPRRRDVEEIRHSAERAASLTRQLLAFSRKQVMQPRIVSLNDVIRSVERLLKRLMGEDIQLVLELDADLVPVLADPGQLEQVLMNLAANARDAMPEGGRVLIRTSTRHVVAASPAPPDLQPGTYAVLTVTDTGVGVPSSVRDRVFEPFFTTKEVGKGTGLGLSTVYGIVTQSGGKVYLETDEGQGTTFAVYLPRALAPTSSL
ncbi:MAG TPA: ATP-binding protein [Vicinamibacterales bacterium]|nr:ATP-binding protein [Vicinamibacterales bacterium]